MPVTCCMMLILQSRKIPEAVQCQCDAIRLPKHLKHLQRLVARNLGKRIIASVEREHPSAHKGEPQPPSIYSAALPEERDTLLKQHVATKWVATQDRQRCHQDQHVPLS